jgi:N-acetylneuraminic acid mutarotase
VSLYFSEDEILDSLDTLCYCSNTRVPAGVVGFTTRTTVYSELSSLPAPGMYYIILELRPGWRAPLDDSSSNNTVSAGPVQVGDVTDDTVDWLEGIGAWETLASTGWTDDHGLAQTSNGSIYMIGGGCPSHAYGAYSEVRRYDPATDTWSTVASMNEPRRGVAAVTLDDKVYAIGGGPYGGTSETVEVYDPNVGHWTYVSSMFIARSRHGACEHGGKIYVFGGITPKGLTNSIEIYDPNLNQWSISGDKIPGTHQGMTAVPLGEDIYLFGARGTFSHPVVYRYTPDTHAWATLTSPNLWFTWGDERTLAAALGETLVYMGSQHGDERSFAYFNLPSGPWTTGPDPGDTGHDGGALLASGGYIYAIGGYTYGPSVERYDPRKILELNTPALGVAVSGTVHILGSADRTDFDSYRLEIKASSAPDSAYATIHESDTPILFDTLAIWDSTSVPDGQYTLRLTMKASVASGSLQDSITKGFIVRQAN